MYIYIYIYIRIYIYICIHAIPYEWCYDQPGMDKVVTDLEVHTCCMLKVQIKQGAPWHIRSATGAPWVVEDSESNKTKKTRLRGFLLCFYQMVTKVQGILTNSDFCTKHGRCCCIQHPIFERIKIRSISTI